jgi:hypothetical protein
MFWTTAVVSLRRQKEERTAAKKNVRIKCTPRIFHPPQKEVLGLSPSLPPFINTVHSCLAITALCLPSVCADTHTHTVTLLGFGNSSERQYASSHKQDGQGSVPRNWPLKKASEMLFIFEINIVAHETGG